MSLFAGLVAVATCRACGHDMRLAHTAGRTHERAECPCGRSSISIDDGLIRQRGLAERARWEG